MRESRWLLAFSLLLIAVISGGAFYTVHVRTSAADSEMRRDDRFAVDGGARDFSYAISDVARDVHFLCCQWSLKAELDDDNPANRQRVINNLLNFSMTHGDYEQIRWLDESGNERIRVNRSDGRSLALADSELQNKNQRSYFTRTMLLPEAALYVSPLDLNVENGRITEPWDPVLRIATPVFNSAGARRGIVVLNYSGQLILQRVSDDTSTIADHAALVDGSGYWLLGPEPASLWGFMFNRHDTLATRFPAAWARIAGERSGQFEDADGLWSWNTVYAGEAIRRPGALDAADLDSQPHWKTVAHRGAAQVLAARRSVRNPTLIIAAVLLALLIALTVLLARNMKARTAAELEREQALSDVREATRLREQQERFRSVVEANVNGLMVVDGQGVIVLANPALESMFGYDPSGLLGHPAESLLATPLADDRRQLMLEFLRDPARSKSQERADMRGHRGDGSSFPIEIGVSPLRMEGRVLSLVSIVDISERKHFEQQLRNSETRFRSVVSALSEGVIAIDTQGAVLTCNRSAEQILGMTEEQMKSRTGGLADWKPLREDGSPFPVEDLPVAQTLASGEPRHGVVMGDVAADGSIAWLMVNSEPLFDDESGKLTAAVVSFTDISARRHAESELQRHREHLETLVEERTAELRLRETALQNAEERFRSFVVRAPIAMVVLNDDRLILGNQQFENLFGSLGQLGESLDVLWQRVFPDAIYRQWALDSWITAAAEVTRSGRAMAPREYRMHCADGQPRYMEISGVALDAGFLATFVDITDRREQARRLGELADFNSKVIAGSTQGMLAYRADGQCVMANEAAARLLGATVPRLLEQNFNFIPTWKEHGFLRMAQKAMGAGTVEHGERQFLSTFGKPAWIAFDFVPFTREGDPHVMSIFSDVSAFRQAEATLREGKELAERASEAKGQFLANMSHEIRTPMNAILGLAQLMERSGLGPDQADLLRKITVAGRTLLAILNDILDFSKIEAGQLAIEQIPFSLASVLENLSTVMSSSAGDKDLELLIIEPELVDGQLIGDPLRLQQILVNLTSNAIKFTERGKVELSIGVVEKSDEGLRLRFAVRDTGIGIHPAQKVNIFEAFTQADSSTTRRFGGTGLGLSICKRIVDLMSGRIGVISEPGRGSEFWFELPFRLNHERRTKDPGWTHLNLLVVDDHEAARDVLAVIARSLGWRVETAASGIHAVETIRNRRGKESLRYDVIVMDWRMPELDGLAASRMIRDILGAEMPPIVILVTAHGREAVMAAADASFADVILTKPVTGSMLHDAIVEALTSRSGKTVQTTTTVEAVIAPGQQLAGLRIMIVDDNLMNQEIAQRILALEGAVTSVAGNGREAVELLKADPDGTDIVLMDVQMPVMDGLKATQAIRQELQLHKLPIIALTAGVLGEERDRVFAAGMNDFLCKPYDVEQMIAMIALWTRQLRSAPAVIPAAVSMAADAAFPSIAGIEINEVRQRLANDVELFRSLLQRFIAENNGTVAGVRAELDRGDTLAAMQRLHKLRGGAANLSARQVVRFAADVEDRIRQNQFNETADLLDELDAALSGLALAARAWLTPAPMAIATTVDESSLRQLVNELAMRRINAVKLFQQLHMGIAARFGEDAAAALRDQIDGLNFEKAGQQLQDLIVRP